MFYLYATKPGTQRRLVATFDSEQLRTRKEAIELLKQKGRERTVTLVYGARDQEHNAALVLHRLLEGSSR